MTERLTPRPDQIVSGNSVVVATETQISSDLAGEAIILELKAGMYYGLDAIGTRIWSLIQEPRSVSSLRETLLSEYEVDAERCEHELLSLLQDLAANRLIRIEDEVTA
jgi:hypothetical protein